MYEITFTPRISEIDINEKVKITALMDYLQHIAYIHADKLGVGHHQIFHKNLTWLLLRYTVEIVRYPRLDEVLKVSSWVAESNSPKYTIRDFEIIDENNNIICKATTSWLLFNYRRRQTVNFMDYWPDFKAEEKRALNYDFPGLQLPEKIDTRKSFKVRKQDLDINQHVNHIAHIHWILEGMPEKIVKNYILEKIEISYKQQGFYEDDIQVETEIMKEKKKDTIKAFHQIIKGKKRELISKAITYWKS
ncbi:MAG: acyl-[acyl-carrier-protein] thioesterase [Candidatus Heimdallarchaeaceae archaeon]